MAYQFERLYYAYNDREDDMIRRLHKTHSLKVIAFVINRPVESVRRRAKKLGLTVGAHPEISYDQTVDRARRITAKRSKSRAVDDNTSDH